MIGRSEIIAARGMNDPAHSLILMLLILVLCELAELRGRSWWLGIMQYVGVFLVFIAFNVVKRQL